MAEFTKDRYGVDVMKVEVPVTIKFVEGAHAYSGKKAYTKQEAMEHFRAAAAVATKPFIYLSAGVSNAEFTESLRLAAEAGVKFAGSSAAGRPGRMAFRSMPRAARRRSASGSNLKASRTSAA